MMPKATRMRRPILTRLQMYALISFFLHSASSSRQAAKIIGNFSVFVVTHVLYSFYKWCLGLTNYTGKWLLIGTIHIQGLTEGTCPQRLLRTLAHAQRSLPIAAASRVSLLPFDGELPRLLRRDIVERDACLCVKTFKVAHEHVFP